jgi:hypothetical protein
MYDISNIVSITLEKEMEREMNTNAKKFDAGVKDITVDRGDTYGHPSDDFAIAYQIAYAVDSCPDPRVKHALRMIAVKMARLCTSPFHIDSLIDIAGYSRTIAMIADKDADDA